MPEYIFIIIGAASLGIGAILGYFTRQNIAKFQAGSIEDRIQQKLSESKRQAENIVLEAKKKAFSISEKAKKEIIDKEKTLMNLEKKLERRQGILEQKTLDLRRQDRDLRAGKEEVERLKRKVMEIISQKNKELEKIANFSKEEAKKEIIKEAENEYKKDIEQKILKLEKEGEEKFTQKAKEILAFAVQRGTPSFLEDLTVISVSLPDDEIKGRIIGKEGRNIKAFENATGVELIVDETPNVVFLSSFDPLRREIAKIALLELIKDRRIQPARIEETIKKIEDQMPKRIQKIGEEVCHELKLFGFDSKLYQLLGRLKFRTSLGQNALDHSKEVAYIANTLAEEIGADSKIAKKAGLFHDIGKAVDWEIEGSHAEIGFRILKKFGVEEEVIQAVRSHHEEYPYETIESVITQTADVISAARPGARKVNAEDYLKRIRELEKIAMDFEEVKNAYAIEAGRELRVFVRSEEIDDFGTKKLAREITKKIEEELQYPGEIKVNVIRETRVVEYAR